VTEAKTETRPLTGAGSPASQQVSWWDTHEFITALVAQANHLPPAGTPAWCALDDTDPAKLLALAAAGEHFVLRLETAQEALAQASRDVAAAVDCQAIANGVQRQQWRRSSGTYIPRAKVS
jgi:hypothetical protein